MEQDAALLHALYEACDSLGPGAFNQKREWQQVPNRQLFAVARALEAIDKAGGISTLVENLRPARLRATEQDAALKPEREAEIRLHHDSAVVDELLAEIDRLRAAPTSPEPDYYWLRVCKDGTHHDVVSAEARNRPDRYGGIDGFACGPHRIEPLYAAPPAMREALEEIAKGCTCGEWECECGFIDHAPEIARTALAKINPTER